MKNTEKENNLFHDMIQAMQSVKGESGKTTLMLGAVRFLKEENRKKIKADGIAAYKSAMERR